MSMSRSSVNSVVPSKFETGSDFLEHLRHTLHNVLIALMGLVLLSGCIPLLLGWSSTLFGSPESIIAFTLLPILLIIYLVNQRGAYYLAAWLLVLVLSAAILVYALLTYSNFALNAAYLLIPTLLASLLIGLRAVVLLTVVQLGAVLLMSALMPNPYIDEFYADPFFFLCVATFVISLVGYQRNRLETVRSRNLQEAEYRNRVVFESPAIGVALSDAYGLTHMNQHFLDMLGYQRDELLGKSASVLTHPDDWTREQVFIEEMLAGKRREYQIEKRYVRKNGSQFWVRVTASFLPSAGQAFPAIGVVFVEDISERKRIESALRESEQRFLQLMNNVEAVFWISEPDNQRPVYISPGYRKIYLEEPDILYREFHHWQRFVHPEDRARVQNELRRRERGQLGAVEYRIERVDGTTRYLLDRAFAIREDDGGMRYIGGITVDITERREAELALLEAYDDLENRIRERTDELQFANEALKQQIRERERVEEELVTSQRRLQALFDNVLDPILLISDDGHLIDVNPAAQRFLNSPREKLLHETVWNILPDRQALPQLQDLEGWQHFLHAASDRGEISLSASSGQSYELEFHRITNILPNVHLVLLHDITEQKRAQQIEVQVERQKAAFFQQFISNTSHDLRTPISILNTSTYLLKRLNQQLVAEIMGLQGVSEAAMATIERLITSMQQRVANLEFHINHLESMVETMHEMVRLDMDTQFEFTPSDLNQIIDEIVQSQMSTANAKSLTLQFEPGSAVVAVPVDAYEFKHVVRHLLENAICYTPAGGQIRVRTYLEHTYAVLEVADTGIGITAQDLPHIFERLYRADKARSLETGGFGLGLSIVKKIVDGHGGQIEVRSEIGLGTQFRVLLPLNPQAHKA